jgi:hypothetical protein
VPAMSPATMPATTSGKRGKCRAGADHCYCGHYDHQLAHVQDLRFAAASAGFRSRALP